MAGAFEITTDLDQLDKKLLLYAQPHLPTAIHALNDSIPFIGLHHNRAIGVCLVRDAALGNTWELLNWGVDPEYRGNGYGRALLLHTMDYARVQGARFLETGCGNAELALFATFQRMGFRVAGIWQDYYTDSAIRPVGKDSLVNRDLIRLQIDLSQKLHKAFHMGHPAP